MRIVIPTRGRTDQQLTLSMLPKELREQTTVVAPKKEIFKLESMYVSGVPEYLAQPDPDMKIGDKRAWILEEFHRRGHDKIIMLDDDLRFATRISETDWHLREIKGEELIPEFNRIAEKLSPELPHAGFGQRQGNNQRDEIGWQSPGKMCYALGYFLPVVIKECVLRRIALREDMELTLQLLTKGYPNAVYHTTVVDQRGYDKPGGTSFERTVELSNAEALRLKELFPAYVSTTERAYKASVPRVEVIVQWQKALEDGRRYRDQIKATSVS